jgi:glucan 1,3-beta-glucosidase
MACAGNPGEICGGNQRLDVYQSSTAWKFLGCYTDKVLARTLDDYITVPGGQGATTIENCQAACRAAGYTLAGVEYANECCKFLVSLPLSASSTATNFLGCDNAVRNGGALAPNGNAGCNMTCAGNSAETCGGNFRLDLYQYL